MKAGLFEPGDYVTHKRLGFQGQVTARYANGNLLTTYSNDALDPADLDLVNSAAISDAFEVGFKSAGGTIIPDGARDMVELSLTRDQIDALATAADEVVGAGILPYRQDEALSAFLETISIYRRKI